MRKITLFSFSILLLISTLFINNDYASAVEKNNGALKKPSNAYTLGEIQNILQSYLKSKGKNYKIDSKEFEEFANDQLLNDTDKELANRADYSLICDFLVSYLEEKQNFYFANENNQSENSFNLNNIKDKTIGQVAKESQEEEEQVEQISQKHEEESKNKFTAMGSSYSVSKAQAYARKWYNGRNKNYANFTGSGGDCTNYVSQILYAGGKKEKQDSSAEPFFITSTTSYWYSFINRKGVGKAFRQGRAISTSWVRVSDFGAYWARTQTVKTYSNVNDVVKNAKPGDVVQFMKKGRSTYFHTMFVYGKSGGTLQLSGHSDDYLKRNIKKVRSIKRYRLIKF
ncbi:amidase domain-containing protein [Bacillus atrophaeus]|uniref:amidase domain-containing protein n=1 Tax=Bacillus atrophaeus TaxID=1452 RepID=UPI002DB561DC|nr:amidase domain-containing protein [Bacillus atrophaeus]MEC0696628.1 amidase domain-containing protein [Bacillus atrophaeus]